MVRTVAVKPEMIVVDADIKSLSISVRNEIGAAATI
jgi:ABC-type oligopeptide transport system ATPase subunit